MAFDEGLASRIRDVLKTHADVVEKKMFGGLAFLARGNMVCGIVGDTLMVRVGPERNDEALARPHARPMDFAGRPMKGMVYVAPEGIAVDAELARWVGDGFEWVMTLPAKPDKANPAARPASVGKAAGAGPAGGKRSAAKPAAKAKTAAPKTASPRK